MREFLGKTAFVTGGASGIGYGLVRSFLQLGMKVVAVDWLMVSVAGDEVPAL